MSTNIAEAILSDGTKLPYVVNDDPPRGGMKYTYFAPDKSYVVQFFNNPAEIAKTNIKSRLEAIIGKYNPTRAAQDGGAQGNTQQTAKYFASKFCWPTAIIKSPEFGIVCPTYPGNFFFSDTSSAKLPLNGRDKKSNWFTSKNRKYLDPSELGDFRSMLQIAIILARSIRRMHQAGLSHSDLSCNNVLIDPRSGTCIIIDIDSLVVPGLFPPEVAGTPKYIAPEVLETTSLSFNDKAKKLPCAYTDLHAMAVLIYEYFFMRHPLSGPKVFSKASAEEDDFLGFGSKALFIENPHDTSNRPKDLKLTIKDFGSSLEKLFLRAFVDGLHNPNARPAAMEWEKALTQAWDLLQPCTNPKCSAKWFILHDPCKPVCPFCGHKVNNHDFIRLQLKSNLRGNSAQWRPAQEINVYDGLPLFEWHIFPNIYPDEKANRDLMAYVRKVNNQWLLINHSVQGMKSPGGNLVPSGQAILLNNGAVFLASDSHRGGYLVEVKS